MWGLLASTIITSAADSLNPIAITQQFVLQGMVKKPKHIWFFIIPTGVTNLIGGFFAYYGLLTLIGGILQPLLQRYRLILFIGELILGVAFLIAVGYIIQNIKIQALQAQIQALRPGGDANTQQMPAVRTVKSVSPSSLVVLGVAATISELATALPYFAFLAILFHYHLSWPQVTFILVVYNIIYMSPLMVLYFVYIKAQDRFDHLYSVIQRQITKWANILAPGVVGVIGVLLVFHSVSALLR